MHANNIGVTNVETLRRSFTFTDISQGYDSSAVAEAGADCSVQVRLPSGAVVRAAFFRHEPMRAVRPATRPLDGGASGRLERPLASRDRAPATTSAESTRRRHAPARWICAARRT